MFEFVLTGDPVRLALLRLLTPTPLLVLGTGSPGAAAVAAGRGVNLGATLPR